MSVVLLFRRTYVRYIAPLTLLSVIAFSPLIVLALRISSPTTSLQAQVDLRLTWAFAGCSLVPLFVLVGGVAPAVRAIASGAPRSQLRVLGAGIIGLAHACVPCLLAVAAIAIGSLALAIPGLMLLILLALVGASTAQGAPAKLADSMAIARMQLRPIIAVLVVTLGVQAILIYVIERQIVPLPQQPPPAHLAMFRHLVRISVGAIAIAAAAPAVMLASIHTRSRSHGAARRSSGTT